MPYLIDSNIFLRIAGRNDPDRQMCINALLYLAGQKEALYYSTQNLVEFWNVCTRPATARGGLGLSIPVTERKARLIERRFRLLTENAATHQEWRRLVAAHAVHGVEVHDTMLAAVMRVYNIPNLLTFDKKDFKRFPGVRAISPPEVLQPPAPTGPVHPAQPPSGPGNA
ncbi:MAG: type II toxin-antitoxin system VapC family toxin [Blastocatellia bacterium]